MEIDLEWTMRTEWTPDGWKEITTKLIRVTQAGHRPLMPISDWLAFNKRHPSIGRKRSSCKCCKEKWEMKHPDGHVHLLFTDKGNMSVCEACFSRYKHIGVDEEPATEKGESHDN